MMKKNTSRELIRIGLGSIAFLILLLFASFAIYRKMVQSEYVIQSLWVGPITLRRLDSSLRKTHLEFQGIDNGKITFVYHETDGNYRHIYSYGTLDPYTGATSTQSVKSSAFLRIIANETGKLWAYVDPNMRQLVLANGNEIHHINYPSAQRVLYWLSDTVLVTEGKRDSMLAKESNGYSLLELAFQNGGVEPVIRKIDDLPRFRMRSPYRVRNREDILVYRQDGISTAGAERDDWIWQINTRETVATGVYSSGNYVSATNQPPFPMRANAPYVRLMVSSDYSDPDESGRILELVQDTSVVNLETFPWPANISYGDGDDTWEIRRIFFSVGEPSLLFYGDQFKRWITRDPNVRIINKKTKKIYIIGDCNSVEAFALDRTTSILFIASREGEGWGLRKCMLR